MKKISYGIFILSFIISACSTSTPDITKKTYNTPIISSYSPKPVLNYPYKTYENNREFDLEGIKNKIHLKNLGEYHSWKCHDLYDFKNKKTIAETFMFKKESLKGTGIILFEGGDSGQSTSYARNGLDHRWNIGTSPDKKGYGYAFIIKSNGTGLYYDFSMKSKGVKPKQFFECIKSN